ncbi:MAG: glycosyltransferase family A protein [Terriglobales bacterium]
MATLSERGQRSGTYVLMTAAHNEESFIEGTIQSVLAQTLLPVRWVIVSDNSSDRTDEIVESYARKHDFIRFLRITRPPGRNFGAKVIALQKAGPLLEGLSYEFIGNLDGDLTLEPFYFEELVGHFRRHPELGLVSGFVYEDSGNGFRSRRINDVRNVPHAAQLVRRECYEAIGGYKVLQYGGEDWYAQTTARMKGWQAESLPELKIFHHRQTGTGSTSLIRNAFRLGRLDYSFGSDPLFEIVKCLRRIPEKPYFGNALARLAGFTWPYLRRESRGVPDEFIAFMRRDQKGRISSILNRKRSTPPVVAGKAGSART